MAAVATPKKLKIAPRLAIGQPFVPALAPPATPGSIPEPATLVGDSGTSYARVGDNPNGPETLSVTPPPGPVRAPVGKVPSMATGGVVTIGNGVYQLPYQGGEDPLLGQANFLRSMDTSKYSQLGVPAPTSVNATAGQPLFAGTQPALQSSTDEMLNNLRFQQATQDVQQRFLDQSAQQQKAAQESSGLVEYTDPYTGRKSMTTPFNAAVLRARANQAVSDAVNPPTSLESRLKAARQQEQEQALAGNVQYQDPFTGKISYMSPAQAAIRKAKDEEKLKQQITGLAPGQVEYTDPWTGQKTVMTEADAAIQKAKDNARIASAASGQYIDPETGAVTQLTPAQAAIARAQEAKRQAQIVSGVPEGYEKYTDLQGNVSALTPGEAAIRKMHDQKVLKDQYEQQYGQPLDSVSETNLLKALDLAKPPKNPDGTLDVQNLSPQALLYYNALRNKGYSPEAIDLLFRLAGQSGSIDLTNIPGSSK